MKVASKRTEASPSESMTETPAFRIRLGAPKGVARPKLKSFIGRMKALVREHGGVSKGRRSRGGRGGTAAARLPVRGAPQRVAIKTRVINHGKYRRKGGAAAAIQDEFAYLRRRGVAAEGEPGVAFDMDGTLTGEELTAFRDRMAPDRHHFRVMVSPERGAELELPGYSRELMTAVQHDLGSRLEWFGVAHYDTDNPHVHLVLRGRDDTGRDLVISRDYISHGMRLQAGEIATRTLGPRRAKDIEQSLVRDLKAERVTILDRHIDRQRAEHPGGLVSALRSQRGDLAREADRVRTLARLQHLESLGLAREVSAGLWLPDPKLLERLKALSLKGDIVKTIHARQTGKPHALDPLILDKDHPPQEVLVGRVIAKGRVDEFWDDEYILLDTQRGRAAYLPLHGLRMSGEVEIGTVVRVETGRAGRIQVTALGSDLDRDIHLAGVTALDGEIARRQESLTSRQTAAYGFAQDYERAMRGRLEHLQQAGQAVQTQGQWRVRAGFLDELYAQELQAAEARLRRHFGDRQALNEVDVWRGTVRAIEPLPSGPHAVVERSGRYVLVPANPALNLTVDRPIQLKVKAPAVVSSLEPRARQWTFEVATMARTRGLGRS